MQYAALHDLFIHMCDMTHLCVVHDSFIRVAWLNYFMCLSTLQPAATHCNTLQHPATHCNTLICVYLLFMCIWFLYPLCIYLFRVFQIHTATHCNTPQHTATHCNTLQHTATHCNTLQQTNVCLSTFHVHTTLVSIIYISISFISNSPLAGDRPGSSGSYCCARAVPTNSVVTLSVDCTYFFEHQCVYIYKLCMCMAFIKHPASGTSILSKEPYEHSKEPYALSKDTYMYLTL